MVNVGQGEVGDPHGVESVPVPPEENDDPEVNLGDVGPPVMTTKEMMMSLLTEKMA